MLTHQPDTRLPLGRVELSQRAAMILHQEDIAIALQRVACGDWGDVDSLGKAQNLQALQTGDRLLSIFQDSGGTAFWIITEPDRVRTTVLLPDEY